jgi:putative FmdB family regulatory protein
MPRYEYECAKCEKVIEVTQKFTDAPLAHCPDCSGPVSKVFSQSSFALKGTGWYTTDYKRAGSSSKSE